MSTQVIAHDNADWNPYGFTPGCPLRAKRKLPIEATTGGFTINIPGGMKLQRIWKKRNYYRLKVLDPDGNPFRGIFKAQDFELDTNPPTEPGPEAA